MDQRKSKENAWWDFHRRHYLMVTKTVGEKAQPAASSWRWGGAFLTEQAPQGAEIVEDAPALVHVQLKFL